VVPAEKEIARLTSELLTLQRKLRLFESEQTQLQQELERHQTQIKQLQEQKRELISANVDDTSFADTYEEVMAEEFRVMREAYEGKLSAAKDQIKALERDRKKEIDKLLIEHRTDRARDAQEIRKLRVRVQ